MRDPARRYRGGVRRLAFLLKPGWLALVVIVVAFAGFCFSTLAPWQLGKNGTTEARNDRIASSFGSAPVPWGELVTPGTTPAADTEWRSVTVTGRYLPGDEALARLRSADGGPAYEVLTPLLVTDGPGTGAVVLVDRGYVSPVQGTDVPAYDAAPGGTVTLAARLRQDEVLDPARGVVADPGTVVPQVYQVSSVLVGGLAGTPVSPGYLQLEEGQPGVLGVLPLPQLDAGPYLSYGLQWIAFGVMAPLGLAYFVRAELRERRAARAEAAGDDDPSPAAGRAQEPPAEPRGRRGNRAKVAAAAREDALRHARPAGAEPVTTVPASAPPRVDALADRYGKRR